MKLTLALSLLVFGTLAGQGLPTQGSIQPDWVASLPDRPGRVYALGLASFSPGEAQGIQQAQAQARMEVLARLRASVKGETNVRSSLSYTQQVGGAATGSTSKSISQDTQVQVRATELPGLVMEETWLDREGRTAYALAYLDVLVAERELRIRFQGAQKDLAAQPVPSADRRERLRKLQQMKRSQRELLLLDDLAGLITAGGGDPQLLAGIHDQRLALDRQMDQLRASVLFGVRFPDGSRANAELVSLVRNTILKQGLGWSTASCDFYVEFRRAGEASSLDPQASRWWDYMPDPPPGYVVARGALEIALVDASGAVHESTTVQAKGVGVNPFGADRDILKKYQAAVERALTEWLEGQLR